MTLQDLLATVPDDTMVQVCMGDYSIEGTCESVMEFIKADYARCRVMAVDAASGSRLEIEIDERRSQIQDGK